MTLVDLPGGTVAKISALKGGSAMAARLHAFGLFPGSRIRLVRTAPLGGPIMIEDVTTGARVMIGRGMAATIEVSQGDSTKSR